MLAVSWGTASVGDSRRRQEAATVRPEGVRVYPSIHNPLGDTELLIEITWTLSSQRFVYALADQDDAATSTYESARDKKRGSHVPRESHVPALTIRSRANRIAAERIVNVSRIVSAR